MIENTYFISKRLWEYDPLLYSIQKYWEEYNNNNNSNSNSNNNKDNLEEKYLCQICYEEYNIELIESKCIITNQKYCQNCLKLYLENKINDGQVLSGNQIKCPCSNINCNNIIQNDVIIKLFQDNQDIINKFHQFSLNIEIASDNTRVFCPNKQCGAVVNVKSSWLKNATCNSCNLKFCTLCKETHNPLISCSMVSSYFLFIILIFILFFDLVW